MPLISVIVPVRNGGTYLRPAIESVLTQTVCDMEIIVVDDHSTDDAISELPDMDSRIRVVKATQKGIVCALNQGIAIATGTWIARMDGDDICLPDRFEQQLNTADTQQDECIVGGCVEIFRDDGPPFEGLAHYQQWINALTHPDDIRKQIFIECPIPHPTFFMRRTTINNLGGYRLFDGPEDYDLLLRAFAQNIKMLKPTDTILHWRDHPTRLSRNHSAYRADRFIRLKAQYLAQLGFSEVIIWGAGRGGKLLHDALLIFGVETKAFIDISPARIGGRARNRPVKSIDAINTSKLPIFVAVGTRGARGEIEQYLCQRELVEGIDFWFTA